MRMRRAHVGFSWLLLTLVAGCGGGEVATTARTPAPAPVPAALTVVSGNDQDGTLDDPLPVEVHFRVADSTGRPLGGVTVHLEITEGGGTVPQSVLTTDGDGEVQTPWTLGPAPGLNRLEARLPGSPSAVATANASSCDLINCVDDRIGDNPNDWKVLNIPTYDGSGEITHPDVVRGGLGLRWLWMAVTPYPNSDTDKENPSLFQSHNGRFWRIPKGLTNPVVKPADGYLSDPDLVFDAPTKRFWMYYRHVTQGMNNILLVRSTDGVRWDAPIQVVSVPSHQAVSPTVVHNSPAAPWIMWVADAQANGCTSRNITIRRRTSQDGINWSIPYGTDLAQPGQIVWHLDIEWVPARSEYWALYNTYPVGGTCATNAVYFARSRDGISWTTYPSPVIRKGVLPALRDLVYRSSMLINDNADSVRLFVSGAVFENSMYAWSTATVARRTDELFADVEIPPPVNRPSDPIRRDLPPPEPDVGPVTKSGSGLSVTPPRPRRIRQ